MFVLAVRDLAVLPALAAALFLGCSSNPRAPAPVASGGRGGSGGASGHVHGGAMDGGAGAGGTVGPVVDGGARPSADGRAPDDLRPAVIEDLNPDPHILEVNLDARVSTHSLFPGTSTELWTYGGLLPGPQLRLRAGDRLIVHFTNNLPEPTTIHWHGLRIPPEMDGVPDHPTPAVPPGGTFRYDFVVPDAGLYWYHPHSHSAVQLGYGLYGTLVVDEAAPEPAVADLGDEVVLVLSDIDVLPSGQLGNPDGGGSVATLFGREGVTILVNGKVKPTLAVPVGRRQRLRIVNAAKSRYFQLAAEGQEFLRIGGDGGRNGAGVKLARPVLTPGERLDLLWEPRGEAGTTVPMRWVPYDRGYGSTFARPEEDILDLAFTATTAPPSPPLPATLPPPPRPIVALPLAGATPVSIRLTRNDINKQFYLGINGKPFGGDDHVLARLGETQVWTVENEIDFAHPFHIHGFFFQVLDENGAPRQPLEWKDTVDVPTKGKLKLAVKFDERPGMWMFHCHILDHADAGMMGMIMLAP